MSERAPRDPDVIIDRGDEPAILLAHHLIDSPAFKALSGRALKVLLRVLDHYLVGPARDQSVAFAISDAQRVLRCSRRRAVEIMAELVAAGFLACIQEAAGPRPRRWRITLAIEEIGP